MWTQNKLFQPQHPQNDPICTCEESGFISCPVHDLEIDRFPAMIRQKAHNDAVELCAIVAADWFMVVPRDRTKAKLLNMIRKQKRGNQ